MQEAGVCTNESGWKIVGGKQYNSSKSGSAVGLWVKEAGGMEGKRSQWCWLDIGGVGRGKIGVSSSK